MKKQIQRMKTETIAVCNICDKEVREEPFNKERIGMVRGLFKLTDFDAHETCINKVTREAFKKYTLPKKPKA